MIVSAPPIWRLVVVDDHDVARLGLVAILESIPGMSVVAEAKNAGGAVEAVCTHNPDAVLLDVRMPNADGLSAARRIHALRPQTRVVMVSYLDWREYVLEALRAGAAGFISKGASRDQIEDEIRRVLTWDPDGGAGDPRSSSQAGGASADCVLRERSALYELKGAGATDDHVPIVPANRAEAEALAALGRLTPRQREVLALVAEGLTNKEVGERLGISPRTVQKNLQMIYRRLEVPNRTHAAMVWAVAGWPR